MEKLSGESMDIVAENVAKLKEIFPDVFSEGKIDFEALEATLGEYVDHEDERYSFTWNGKAQARRIAQTPSTGTLRPAKEESKDWDTTQNLYIEGDNLEVLKLLQKSYHKKVKMIYIDPPYNTGKDFVYKDNFKDNLKNYLEITGQVDSEGNKLSTNSDTSGRYHSDWLNMMYPRLKLARNLLKDDGVIFISIDDNEVSNLRKICDEIFGEDNFEAEVSWRRRHNQPNDKSKMIAKVSEYILVYSKSSEALKATKSYFGVPLTEERIKEYKNPDNDPNGNWTSNPWKAAIGRGGSTYTIETPTGKIYDETWYGNKDTFELHIKNNRVHWTDNGDGFPRIKKYLSEALVEGQPAIDFFRHELYGSNSEGSEELKSLLQVDGAFDNPKPIRLLLSLLKISTKNDDLIIDFFSGSASTAHAVMKLNSDDGGNRKYIMVQLQELTEEKSIINKAGYKNICEIGKERIRRAGEKVKQESGKGELDVGFKVLKLDSSNIKTWDADFENLQESLFEAVDNIKSDRSADDLLYEILLKYGLDLTLPIEELELVGKKVYVIGFGALVVCLDEEVTLDTIEAIAKLKEEYQADDLMRVVFRDNGFKDAEVKTNAIQILKQYGIEDVKSV